MSITQQDNFQVDLQRAVVDEGSRKRLFASMVPHIYRMHFVSAAAWRAIENIAQEACLQAFQSPQTFRGENGRHGC